MLYMVQMAIAIRLLLFLIILSAEGLNGVSMTYRVDNFSMDR